MHQNNALLVVVSLNNEIKLKYLITKSPSYERLIWKGLCKKLVDCFVFCVWLAESFCKIILRFL